MLKVTIMSLADRPTFEVDGGLSNAQISKLIANRYGYATMPPFAGACWALPHSWYAVIA